MVSNVLDIIEAIQSDGSLDMEGKNNLCELVSDQYHLEIKRISDQKNNRALKEFV